MTPSVTSSSSTSAAGANPYAALAPAAPSSDVSKNMFLQLMVAQLKNQDPLNPSDSTQFVTELAQMQQLEQAGLFGQGGTDQRQTGKQNSPKVLHAPDSSPDLASFVKSAASRSAEKADLHGRFSNTDQI